MNGKRFLLVEDESLIALLVAEIGQETGHVVAHEASTVDEALQLAPEGESDAAILDTNLGGKPIFAVAEMLAERGIPFFFSTGYQSSQLQDPWNRHCVMSKPFDFDKFKETVARLFYALPSVPASSLYH
jgi:CheY-like chemotaxis protein